MMFSPSLLITLLLALSIAASSAEVRNSLVTLPIIRRLNTSNGAMNILQHDQARVAARKGRSASLPDRRDAGIATVLATSQRSALEALLIIVSLIWGKKLWSPMDDCLTQTNWLSTLVARSLGLAPMLRTRKPAPVSALVKLYSIPTLLLTSPV